MDRPLVTIAMPVFNAGKLLPIAITSIVNQTYPNWELIVIDDGSSDGCCGYLSVLDDKRIKLFKDGINKGLAARLNQAIDLAKGDYFARMDQDDIAFPQRLATQVAFLQKNLEIDLVSSRVLTFVGCELLGQLPFRESHNAICAKPWSGFYMPHPTWMGKTAWFRKYHYFDPEVKLAEDQELLLRSYPESKFASISEPLLAYRLRPEISLQRNAIARSNLLRVQLREFRQRCQVRYSILAVFTYVGKLLLDLVTMLGLGKQRAGLNKVSEDDMRLWQDLCKGVGLSEK